MHLFIYLNVFYVLFINVYLSYNNVTMIIKMQKYFSKYHCKKNTAQKLPYWCFYLNVLKLYLYII